MKKIIPLVLVLVLVMAVFTGCTVNMQTDTDTSNDVSFDANEELYKLLEDDSCNQVFTVMCRKDTTAYVQFLIKEKASNGMPYWQVAFDCDAYIGKEGSGKTHDGVAITPVGVFRATEAFGIKDNPGTKLKYIPVTNDTYGCGCQEYYNQIVDAKKTGHVCQDGEKMAEYTPEYNYGLAFDYNKDNVYGEGGLFFIHCQGPKEYTGGCVAIPEENMKYILQHATNGMAVMIFK